MIYRTVAILSIFMIGSLSLARSNAQSLGGSPKFEIASIKISKNCNGAELVPRPSFGRLNLSCISLRGLIRLGYGLEAKGAFAETHIQVLGGPKWIDSGRYDISAAGNTSSDRAYGRMIEALLEDRFKLRVHRESRDVLVYSLTVAKGGPKLRTAKEGDCTAIDRSIDLNRVPKLPGPGEPPPHVCGSGGTKGDGVTMTAEWYGVSMAEFAGRMLSSNVDRPVIDRTGLTGRFDIRLEFQRDNAPGTVMLNGVATPGLSAAKDDIAGPSIFTAVQQQLGLKLSPSKGAVDVIIIDHVERPSGN